MDAKFKLFGANEISLMPTAAGVLLASILLITYIRYATPLSFPIVGLELGDAEKRRKEYFHNANNLLLEGYRKFRDRIFVITTSEGPSVVLSSNYIDEIKSMPDSKVSFFEAVDESLMSKYTTALTNNPVGSAILKHDLTPNLGNLMSDIDDEVKYSLSTEIGACDDWTPINIHHALLRIVALVSGRVFVGPSFNRDPEWVTTTIQYTVDVFAGSRAIKRWKPWLRPFVKYSIPELRRIITHNANVRRIMVPILKARKTAESKEGYVKPLDLTQWLTERSGPDADNWDYLARSQLSAAMGAIHTTTTVATHTFYELASRPEYIKILREEINSVLAETDGNYTGTTMGDLKKLDSFMKEAFRVNPITLTNFRRIATSALTLSDGTFIPKGSRIEVASYAMSQDSEIIENPDVFDGLRYYKLRMRSPEDANRHQFSTITKDNLNFGYGRHACPGRFFASNEIKAIVANVLQNYDIELVDKEAGRPKNLMFEATVLPDTSKELLFKRVPGSKLPIGKH